MRQPLDSQRVQYSNREAIITEIYALEAMTCRGAAEAKAKSKSALPRHAHLIATIPDIKPVSGDMSSSAVQAARRQRVNNARSGTARRQWYVAAGDKAARNSVESEARGGRSRNVGAPWNVNVWRKCSERLDEK